MPDAGGEAAGVATGAVAGAAAGSIFGPIGAGVGAVVGAIGGFLAGIFASQAGSQKAGIIRAQEAMGMTQAAVGIQRQEAQNTQFLGGATASAGAGGFQKTGTLDTYLGQLATTLKANVSWQQFAAVKGGGLQMQSAQLVQDTGNLQAAGDILGGISAGVHGITQAGTAMKWWGGGPPSNASAGGTVAPLAPLDQGS